MTGPVGLCQARIHTLRPDGTDRCRRQASHTHYAFESGQTLHLCKQHRDGLVKREKRGSSRSMLDHWNGG